MIIDDIRARYPNLGLSVFCMEPGRPVTLETYIDGQVFSFTAPTVEAALAKAFPEMPEPPALSRKTTMRALASLAAAISLLERSPKKAAPSNKMFDQMLTDYRNALAAARAELGADEPTEADPVEPEANVFD